LAKGKKVDRKKILEKARRKEDNMRSLRRLVMVFRHQEWSRSYWKTSSN